MSTRIQFANILPTVFLKKDKNKLNQLVRIELTSFDCKEAFITVKNKNLTNTLFLGNIPIGKSIREIYIDEIKEKSDLEFIIHSNSIVYDKKIVSWYPPKHWSVHIVQLSHHDPGYTDLPSNVLKVHDKWFDDVLAFSEETERFPEDAVFRMVIEQTWSIDHYLKNSSDIKINKMVELMQSGKVELTALFGNMTTEICGHEEIIRALYHSFSLKRKYGIEIMSAEHNDITGISWGLSRVLTDAGIKIFCPGIPLYYNWSSARGNGDLKLQSFWDEKKIFGYKGPGAFWWEAPTGKRILLWCNNQGCGGDCRVSLPGLADKLKELEENNYPYDTLRWPVAGGARDNSPYTAGYAHTIKSWNEKWSYPHLICSTNTKFYNEFIKEVQDDLPVFRGELPGQDYPVGALSTSSSTAQNRNNHSAMISAEKFASLAEINTDYLYQKDDIEQAYEDMLWYDEHAWGHHFPCGPAMRATQYEKAVHAFRAEAFAHDIINKAIARIADNIKLDNEGFYLVVFNSTSGTRTDPLRTPLREIDNCGSTMYEVPPEIDQNNESYLKGVLLGDRWHVNLPTGIVDGKFNLYDVSEGRNTPYQLIPVESPMDNVPYAPERLGLGSGTKRYGFFELPDGLKRDLCFIARDVPAYGYKTYRLIPQKEIYLDMEGDRTRSEIENEFYKIIVDDNTGSVKSIIDKEMDREIVDHDCMHGFNSIIVREPDFGKEQRTEYYAKDIKVKTKHNGIVYRSIEITGKIHGHPLIKHVIALYKGIKKIYFSIRIIKDPTPLIDVHMSFPFKIDDPKFRYESLLSVMDPIKDYLPGSYSDIIAVQNWVKVSNGSMSVLWSSLDSPIAGFSGLHPGYVSPAHRCRIDIKAAHAPMKAEEIAKGWIYSDLFSNNFGTNFSVSQCGDYLFRYVVSTSKGDVSDSAASEFGQQSVSSLEHIMTKREINQISMGILLNKYSFIEIDDPDVILLNFKKAADNNGYIMRFWNLASVGKQVNARFNTFKFKKAFITDIVEQNLDAIDLHEYNKLNFQISANSIMTIRIIDKHL